MNAPLSNETVELAIVGAGPTASSLLERLSANAPELLAGRPLRVHLIDPHRAGTGRVWRPDLHPLLWMNSMAEDVTMFTDDSVQCEGPLRPGPSLHEWAEEVDDVTLAALCSPELAAEIRGLSAMTFPTRLVQSVYLDWFHREVLASLPNGVEVVVHERRAIDVRDGANGTQCVVLEGVDDPLPADVVVLSLGHLDAAPGPSGDALARFASAHGLSYLPPGHTAEQDLSVLEPGDDVIVLGFGQAFTDLVILLTEGRGGRFVEVGDGSLRYEASGREPVVHVGSRRGVPYRSKLDYRLQAAPAPLPRFLDEVAIERLLARDGPVEFRRDLLPLVRKEVGWAYYHELFNAHPERTSMAWEDFAERYAATDDTDEIDRLVTHGVPDPTDRFDVDALNRPLAELRFASADETHRHIARHVVDDVARRTDPTHSADLGAFMGLLTSFGALGRIAASGRLTARSRIEELGTWWFSFFMYYASGPPPARLRQFLALADAGVLRFVGADISVTADAGDRALRRPQHEPSRQHRRQRVRRRPHRHPVGQPDHRRAPAAAPRAGRGGRGGGVRRRRMVGQQRQGRRHRKRPAHRPARRLGAPTTPRRRRVHEPPRRRHVRPAANERRVVPSERHHRPVDPAHARQRPHRRRSAV